MTICLRAALVATPVAFCLASLAVPAAAAGCWTTSEIAAARMRELQTKLAVAALQCRFSRSDVRANYNRFLRNGRPALRAANGRLKARFMAGGRMGLREYDRYTTILANAYGGRQISFGSCARTSAVMTEAALPQTNLQSLAAREVIAPRLPSAACRVTQPVVIAAE